MSPPPNTAPPCQTLPRAVQTPRPTLPMLESRQLLGDRSEVHIAHAGDTYTLRRTRAGKLILTK